MPDAASRFTISHSPELRRLLPSAVAAASLRALLVTVLSAGFLATSRTAYTQTPVASQTDSVANQTVDTQESGIADAGATQSDSTGGSSARGPGTASATLAPTFREIVRVLQQNPDLIVEVKSLVADKMAGQGLQVNPNDITDEMLYNQIAANSNLRTGIVAFLQARGYLSAEDAPEGDGGSVVEGTGAAAPAMQRQNAFPYSASLAGALQAGAASGPDGLMTNESDLSALSAQSMASTGVRRAIPATPTRREEAQSSTDLPKVLRQPSPYNLQSMRDLYTQIPDGIVPLKRFGSEVFVNRDSASVALGISPRDTALDVPLGPDYIVGPGDALTIDLWGGVTESFTRVVDRDGRILLPDAEPVQIAGLSLARAQDLIESALKPQYRNARVAVTVSHLRSVRVYVVGDVQRPGGYEISSLATPLSALYAAGGPTSAGSLRTLLHYRGNQLIETVDLYDFLLHGVRIGSARFESGDTLLIPPAGAQIAVFGAVRRPAIYELKAGESTLASVLDDAGGLTAAASPGNIRIERIGSNHQRETVTVSLAAESTAVEDRNAFTGFRVMDGDRIRVEPVLPYSQRAVYLEGHVVRPGRLAYIEGMRLNDVLRSYRDMLPEPAARGEIVRLVSPDLHAETIEFSVPDVLIGNANVDLEAYDTIRIFGRYEADAPKVTILGEVLRAGVYPMSAGMTAARLVRMAGGFKRDALLDSADLTSYNATGDQVVAGDVRTVRIGVAVSGTDAGADVTLKPGDTLMIHQMTGWDDIGQSVSIQGQVKFPGSYGFEEGEHLSSVLRRSGGLLPTAYPAGAVLIREQVRDLEQKSRDELIRQIETNSAAARLSPGVGSGNSDSTLQLIKTQQDEVISELKSHPPSGRMVIQITSDIDSWASTAADIELRRGDVITIPKRPGFVLVTGQVYNSTALTYSPGKTADWYLRRAGGANTTANRKEILVIRANGSVIGRRSGGWFEGDVLSTRLNPGDVVVVPQKIIGASMVWRNLLTVGQIAASVAITAGVAAAAL